MTSHILCLKISLQTQCSFTMCSMGEDNNAHNQARMASTSSSPKTTTAGMWQTDEGKFGERGNPSSTGSTRHGYGDRARHHSACRGWTRTDEMWDANEEREEDVLKRKGTINESPVWCACFSSSALLKAWKAWAFNTVKRPFPFSKELLHLWMRNTALQSKQENKP